MIFVFVDFKNLRSLEICGGGLTDAGVKNIKDLKSLVLLNLSQNHHLTDKSLEFISGNFLHFTVYNINLQEIFVLTTDFIRVSC